MALVVIGGVQAPFIVALPSFPFNCFLSLAAFHKRAITDKVFRAAVMVAVLLIHLGILHCSSQPDHEFFHHSLDSIWVITLWIFTIISIFFLQLC